MPTHPKPSRPVPTDAPGGHVPVAVVGVGALLPGATGVTDFWRGVLEGRDHMSDVPPTHWLVEDHYDPDPAAVDKTYARRGAFLPQVAFDPLEFGVPPKAIPATDTSQLLALIVARSVLDDLGPEQLAGTDRDRVSVILGTTTLEQVSYSVSRLQRPVWRKAMREAGLPESQVTELCDRIAEHYVPAQEDTFPGALANVVAGRIANKFDFRGSNHTVDAACASSLAALSAALGELTLGRADMVLTGGVDTLTDPGMYLFFSKTPALSPTGDCRPFAENADGTMLGEGLAMFALKRLADAERDGNRVYAVIRGLGSSSDGHGTAVYTPLAQGQAKALRRTYDASGYGPDTVELVEAHGTGTRVGDLAEFTALNTVFTETGRPDRQWCALGSVKSQLGHTKCTAGAVGLLKAVLALHHKVLPPTIKAERPNPDLDLPDSCFYLNTRTRPWVRGKDHPRRAAVSSFGFGGSNFHVTVEEYVAASETGAGGAPAWRCRTAPTELVLLAADSPRELAARCAEYGHGRPLAETARISQRAYRASAPARLAVVATDEADLAAKLARSAETLRSASASASFVPVPAHSSPEGVHLALGTPAPGQVAFLFPGQGSQYIGMGADLAMEATVARSAWDELGAREWEGRPLHRVVFPAPAVTGTERDAQGALLRATEWAQPAIAVHSVASLEVLRALGLRPDRVAGHSFGELVALHAAGVLDAPTLLHVARLRGEAMRDAAGARGAMLAVAAGPEEVADAINGVGHPELWTANRNSPRQTVVGGTVEAVEALRARLADAGTAAVPLETSTAFHTPLVADAVQRMAVLADSVDIGEPTLTVHGNAEGRAWPTAPDEIRRHIAEHIVTPVDFTAVIESMYADGVRTFVEVGPGTVLSGLVDDILGGREHLAVPLDRKGAHGVTSLQEAMARLAVRGIDLDHEALWTEYAPPRPETAAGRTEETRMTVNISGVNSGRPYPPPGGAAQLPPANPEPGVEPGPCAPEQPAPEHMVPAPATVPVPVFPTQPRVAPFVPAPTSPDSDALPSVLSPPPDWLRVIEQAQAQTAEAHAAYQRAFTESHLAFLRVAETSFAAVLGACGIDAGASTGSRELAVPAVPLPAGSPSTMAEPPELPPESAPRLVASPAVVAMPPPAAERERHEVDVEELLRSVVADRTGFPAEMLKMSMDMAAELGIDSIKRVEILGALMERVGNLPSDEISELSTARTLGAVADVLRRHTSPPAGPSAHVAPGEGGDLSGRGAAGGADGAVAVDEEGLSGLSGLPEPSEMVDPSELSGPPEPSRPRCHIVEAVPEDPVGLSPAGLYGSRLVVTDDGRGTGRLVADGLRARGVDAVAVDEVPADARAVVLLGGLAQAATWESAMALQREALRVCGGLAPVLEAEGGLLVVVQDSGGDFGLSGRHGERAWAGGLAALARTAAREWPRATVRAIDCEWGARTGRDVAEVIVREILNGGTALDVGLRADGTRLVPHLTPRSSVRSALDPEQTRELGPEALLVVTGGGRGVTAAALRELARAHRPGLVLVGRTRLDDEPAGLRPMTDEAALVRALAAEHLARRPAEHADATPATLAARARHILAVREIRATLEALRQAGSDARYVTADVRDAGGMSRALDRVRSEWGRPVTGIVHGAGVLADQRIAEKTGEQFDLVFGTKVAGLRALLAATADDPLETIVLFSSVAARFGNTGQADYAMANEVMDQVACVEQHRRRGCLVRSIAWGPWDGGMVDAGLAAHFARSGVGLIHPEAGAQVFTTELTGPSTPAPRVVVTADDPGGPTGFGGPTSHGQRTGPGAARAAELLIRPDTHGHLADHVPGEAPVVPMAFVLDWFARAVRSWQGDAAEVVLRDLRVLRGIECDVRRRDHRSVLKITSQPSSFPGGPVEVQLRADADADADVVLHYRATLVALDATDTGPWPTGHGLPSYPDAGVPGADDVYDSPALFHGPRFRALHTVHGLGPDGAAAEVVGAEELGWADDAWHVDPGALDGALQLALLWAERALGRACLPMSVGTARLPRTGALTAPTTCAVRAGRVRGDTARCDVALLAADGAPRVQLLQVELVARPA